MDPPSDIVSKVTEGNILKVDHEMDYPVPNDGKMLTLFPICNLRLFFPTLTYDIETVKNF